jgi:hypothetical protein
VEDSSAEISTVPASAVLAVANRPDDMLSAVAAGFATSPAPHCPSRKSTFCDAYRRSAVAGDFAPVGNDSWHSDAFVGAKDDESCEPATGTGMQVLEAGSQ